MQCTPNYAVMHKCGATGLTCEGSAMLAILFAYSCLILAVCVQVGLALCLCHIAHAEPNQTQQVYNAVDAACGPLPGLFMSARYELIQVYTCGRAGNQISGESGLSGESG
eukprot:365387-Chlamydomonas_euryale.AAC.4